MINTDQFFTHHMLEYSPKIFDATSFTTIECLSFLKGRPWDAVALGYIHGLRPTSIRVTTGLQTLDARVGRVTVRVNKDHIIEHISQEIQVGLPDGIDNGHHLDQISGNT